MSVKHFLASGGDEAAPGVWRIFFRPVSSSTRLTHIQIEQVSHSNIWKHIYGAWLDLQASPILSKSEKNIVTNLKMTRHYFLPTQWAKGPQSGQLAPPRPFIPTMEPLCRGFSTVSDIHQYPRGRREIWGGGPGEWRGKADVSSTWCAALTVNVYTAIGARIYHHRSGLTQLAIQRSPIVRARDEMATRCGIKWCMVCV